MDETTLDSLLAEGEEDSAGLQAALAAAKDEAASAKLMAYSMKQQMDSLLAHFKHLPYPQPGGLTPTPSEELPAVDGTTIKDGGTLPPGLAHLHPIGPSLIRDARAPFGVKPKERKGPYTPTRGADKDAEKPILSESMD